MFAKKDFRELFQERNSSVLQILNTLLRSGMAKRRWDQLYFYFVVLDFSNLGIFFSVENEKRKLGQNHFYQGDRIIFAEIDPLSMKLLEYFPTMLFFVVDICVVMTCQKDFPS